MARYERFTFLCNKDEKRLIKKLAEKLQRSQSDAVRFLVISAARELEQGQILTSQIHRAESGGEK